MKKKMIDIISVIITTILWIFLIKYLYFDTKIGFSKRSFGFTIVSAPLYFESLIAIIFLPYINFIIIKEFCLFLINKKNNNRHVRGNKTIF